MQLHIADWVGDGTRGTATTPCVSAQQLPRREIVVGMGNIQEFNSRARGSILQRYSAIIEGLYGYR